MTNDDFFQGKQEEIPAEIATIPEKLKVGNAEYTQDELNNLVGLGNKAKELEDRWNTKIDKLYPEYTKVTQKLSEYEKQDQERKIREEAERLKAAEEGKIELTPEEQREQAIKQAEDLGLVHKGNIQAQILQVLQARDLNQEIDKTVTQMAESGLPKITGDELLDHMDKTGIKNPEKAYKDMFETQYEEWKVKQLQSAVKPGMVTESAATGGKEPLPTKVTGDNIATLLNEVLNRQS